MTVHTYEQIQDMQGNYEPMTIEDFAMFRGYSTVNDPCVYEDYEEYCNWLAYWVEDMERRHCQ